MLMQWVKRTYYKGNTESSVVACKEIRPEENVDTTKYKVISRDQNAGRGHSMKIQNSSFERAKELKYLGANLTDQYYIEVENRRRLKSEMLATIQCRI